VNNGVKRDDKSSKKKPVYDTMAEMAGVANAVSSPRIIPLSTYVTHR